jgi:hypothetical protein
VRSLFVLVALLFLAVLYVSWTAGRLDRLHARIDAAWAALDAQLVRRAAAARAAAATLPAGPVASALEAAARRALDAGAEGREECENDLSRALRAALPLLPDGSEVSELETASTRVVLARSFHNAAVRDTRSIRLRRIPRALRLAGHRALPQYFEIDDTSAPAAVRLPPSSSPRAPRIAPRD